MREKHMWQKEFMDELHEWVENGMRDEEADADARQRVILHLRVAEKLYSKRVDGKNLPQKERGREYHILEQTRKKMHGALRRLGMSERECNYFTRWFYTENWEC